MRYLSAGFGVRRVLSGYETARLPYAVSATVWHDRWRECVSGAPNEIWSYGDQVYEICKKYISIRETMRPYTRELMREAHEKGTPVMRPLFYDFPVDTVCWENEKEYMYGPNILVAPVMERGEKTKEVYLPAGTRWTNVWTKEAFEGGQTVTVATPLDQIPLFTREGYTLEV